MLIDNMLLLRALKEGHGIAVIYTRVISLTFRLKGFLTQLPQRWSILFGTGLRPEAQFIVL